MIDGTVMNRTLPLFLLLIVGFYISWNIVYHFISRINPSNQNLITGNESVKENAGVDPNIKLDYRMLLLSVS